MEASSIGIPHNVGLETVSTTAETKAASKSNTEASPLPLRTKAQLVRNKDRKLEM